MQIRWTLPGGTDGWTRETEGDIIPNVGETVAFPHDIGAYDVEFWIKYVIHYPAGSGEYDEGEREPFVYVVLRRGREDPG